jgi:hypothetical protein
MKTWNFYTISMGFLVNYYRPVTFLLKLNSLWTRGPMSLTLVDDARLTPPLSMTTFIVVYLSFA